MNLIILGAPGAGKGAQAQRIVKEYSIPHMSPGDIFRKHIKECTPIGIKAKEYIDKGQLVPDELAIELVSNRLKDVDFKNGYFLDGFPRTLVQAEALDKITKIDAVINLDVDLSKLLARIVARRVCLECGSTNSTDWPGYDGICKNCGAKLVHRHDDTEEIVAKRLDVYKEKTAPLICYYKAQGLLKSVDGMGTPDDVFKRVKEALD